MKRIISKYIKVCPKSGKFRGFRNMTGLSRLLFPIIGLAALIWILVRVIPKPSRLNYPCIKTAMPLAWGFLGYILIFVLSAAAFIKSNYDVREKLVESLLKNDFKSAGEYEVEFDVSQLPTGVYYYRLKSGNNAVTPMILIKQQIYFP